MIYGGHVMGADVPGFQKGQEYTIGIESLDTLSTQYDVLIRSVDVSPSNRRKREPRTFQKMFFLDDVRGMFRQR